jgi:hypothetical protein
VNLQVVAERCEPRDRVGEPGVGEQRHQRLHRRRVRTRRGSKRSRRWGRFLSRSVLTQ